MTTDSANTSGGPGWSALGVLVVTVALAHAWVLQAAPAQFGNGPDANDAGAKTFATRSIAAPTPTPVSTAAAPVKNASNKQNPPKTQSNAPIAKVNTSLTAPEIIANAASPEMQAGPTEAAPNTNPTPTPTQAPITQPIAPASVTAQAAGAQTTPTTPVSPTNPVTAISLPGSVRLLYKVVGLSKELNYQASAEIDWKSNGDSYDAMMKVSAFLIGSRSLSSVGKITGSGLAPTRFADKFRSEQAAHFDAVNRKITFSANTPDAPWVEGAQDQVSVFFQLGGMLAGNPAGFSQGSTITFFTVGRRDADTWTFVIESEENLQLLGAAMPTLKLTRKPRKEFDQKVEIWYAPNLGYLPVRSRITQQNGDFIDQQLTEVVK